MYARDKGVNIAKVAEWNWMSLDNHDSKLIEEFNKGINNEIIPEAENEHTPTSQEDRNTEQTTNMFDSYVDM